MEIHAKKECVQDVIKKDDTIFREYIGNTTAHGVSRVFTKDYNIIRRLFWLVIFLGAAAGCLHNCIDRIRFLASAPTSTSVKVTRVRPLEFPAVTVCNLNTFTASSLEAAGILLEGVGALNIDPLEPEEVRFCETVVNSNSRTKEVVLEDLINSNSSQSLSDFIINCTFMGRPCDMERDFSFYSLGFGSCYTFNGYSMRAPLETNGTGGRQGLFMLLNINQSEYTATPLLAAGAGVFIHPSSEPALAFDGGVSIPPGRVALVSLKKESIINEAGVDCVTYNDNSGFNFLANNFSYSSSACLMDCQLTAVARECGCYYAVRDLPPSNLSYADIRSCTFSDVCCIQKVIGSPVDCNCPSACVSSFFDPATTYSSIPADYARQSLQMFIGGDLTVDRNIIGVSIFYRTLNVRTETTTFSYSPVALLSDIGGQLGLFLGVSVISVLEFCTWLLDEGLDRLCCCKISRKKKTVKDNDQLSKTEKGLMNPVGSVGMDNALKT